MTALFKLLLMILVLRVGWGAWNWIRAISKAGARVQDQNEGYEEGGEEIEDAIFEEIPDEPGNES